MKGTMRRLIAHVQSTPTLWDDAALAFACAFAIGIVAPLTITSAFLVGRSLL